VRCHLRTREEGNFAGNKSMITIFEVIGSPNLASASRFALNVSSRSSRASNVSSLILGYFLSDSNAAYKLADDNQISPSIC
jgi:hypothetical protein